MTVEIKPEEKKEEPSSKFEFKRDHHKSLRQISAELKEKRKKQILEKLEAREKESVKKEEDTSTKEEDKPIEAEEKKEEVKVEPIKEEPKVDHVAIAKQAAEDAARKVAEETKASFKEEIDKILNKDKDIQTKQKEADELVAIWEKEDRLPKDWREIASEQMRISDAKLEQRMKAQQEAQAAKVTEEKENAAKQRNETETQNKTRLEDFQKQIAQDLDDIYSAKLLPRPGKIEEINNPNTTDKAAKVTQEVLQFGVKLNMERSAKGLSPVTSLNKIFFLHYQPYKTALVKKGEQPAGADAPVSGAKNVISPESKNAYNYREDHNKSWRQIAYELAHAKRKALIRS